jgi:hypothetical protein
MSERRFRKPNALKHGAFSGTELLPWEDANEFEELHRNLKEELDPDGPLQDDCVLTILRYMWRKRRVSAKRNLDVAAALDRVENRVLWEDPPPLFDTEIEGIKYFFANRRSEPRSKPPEDYQQLLGFSTSLFRERDRRLLEIAVSMLPSEFSSHLREKLPPDNFEYTSQWVVALKKEVDAVLLPMVRARGHDPDAYLATAAGFVTEDRMLEDLAIEERLDAAIDRTLKRLYQLKVARQLDRPKLSELNSRKPPLQLEGPATDADKVKE